MADLDELNSSGSTKVVGSASDGTEQSFVESGTKRSGEQGLHVIAEVPNSFIDNKIRFRTSFDEINLPANTSPFVELFSYTGSGSFFGFNAEFSQDTVQIQLQLDSMNIFYENGDAWFDLANLKTFSQKAVLGGVVDFNNGIDFAPTYPIIFDSTIKILARSNSGGSNKKMTKIIVELAED